MVALRVDSSSNSCKIVEDIINKKIHTLQPADRTLCRKGKCLRWSDIISSSMWRRRPSRNRWRGGRLFHNLLRFTRLGGSSSHEHYFLHLLVNRESQLWFRLYRNMENRAVIFSNHQCSKGLPFLQVFHHKYKYSHYRRW